MTDIEVVKNARNPEFLEWVYSNSKGNKEIEVALISNPATPGDVLKSIYTNPEFIEWAYSNFMYSNETEESLVSNAETPVDLLKVIYSRALERRKHTEKMSKNASRLKAFNIGA